MHTAAYRANALLTYAGSALAILAVLATLTGTFRAHASACVGARLTSQVDFFHRDAPVLDVRLEKVERLHSLENTKGGRDDEVHFVLRGPF